MSFKDQHQVLIKWHSTYISNEISHTFSCSQHWQKVVQIHDRSHQYIIGDLICLYRFLKTQSWHFPTLFWVLCNMLFRYDWISVELYTLPNLAPKDHIVKGGIVADFHLSRQGDFTEISGNLWFYTFIQYFYTFFVLLSTLRIFWIGYKCKSLSYFIPFVTHPFFPFRCKITFPMQIHARNDFS